MKARWRTAGALCSLAVWAGVQAATPPVATTAGPVQGLLNDAGVQVWRGLPYAAAPVAALRWREPQPPANWTAVRVADQPGPDCMQRPLGPAPTGRAAAPMAEDCLALNIWSAPSAAAKPVMVWIFGGGFQVGSAADPRFDGSHLAQRGVVVVTLNYRVGLLGFLVHPALSQESPHKTSGNYGILDQIAALRWVQANIAAFGGDPARVTVFGQSAGSTSVNILQASPLAQGLFQRAIGQSTSQMDPSVGIAGRRSLAQAEAQGLQVAAELGVKSLAELRALPAEALLKSAAPFWPLERDGHVLPDEVWATFAAGKQNPVALMVGSNSAEGTTIPIVWVKPDATEQPAYDRLYADAPAHQPRTDAIQWQMRTWAQWQARSGRPAWLYVFDQAPPLSPERLRSSGGQPLGAHHGAEVAYVFGNLAPGLAWTDGDRRLSELMMAYWVNLAKNGDPNGPGLPVWPRYDEGKASVMRLADPAGVQATSRPEAQAFIDAYFAKRRAQKAGA